MVEYDDALQNHKVQDFTLTGQLHNDITKVVTQFYKDLETRPLSNTQFKTRIKDETGYCRSGLDTQIQEIAHAYLLHHGVIEGDFIVGLYPTRSFGSIEWFYARSSKIQKPVAKHHQDFESIEDDGF